VFGFNEEMGNKELKVKFRALALMAAVFGIALLALSTCSNIFMEKILRPGKEKLCQTN
jgi:hypothetical protein